jgi:hypothetical protein
VAFMAIDDRTPATARGRGVIRTVLRECHARASPVGRPLA